MYLYRSLETDFDPFIAFLQSVSSNGAINWQVPANRQKIQNVFTGLALAAQNYSMTDGDFRTYMLLKSVNVIYDEFTDELFNAFVSSAYGVDPVTVVGNLETAYNTRPPQNTQFPGLSEGSNSNPMAPLPQKLVPNILYSSDVLED